MLPAHVWFAVRRGAGTWRIRGVSKQATGEQPSGGGKGGQAAAGKQSGHAGQGEQPDDCQQTTAAGSAADGQQSGSARVRKWHPGPKDAAQERREKIHRLTLDVKAARDQRTDLRGSHETAIRVLKLEHQQALENLHP